MHNLFLRYTESSFSNKNNIMFWTLTDVLNKQMLCVITRDQTHRMVADININQWYGTHEDAGQRRDEIRGLRNRRRERGQQRRRTSIKQGGKLISHGNLLGDLTKERRAHDPNTSQVKTRRQRKGKDIWETFTDKLIKERLREKIGFQSVDYDTNKIHSW